MYINATGYYIPEKRIFNNYFYKINGLSDEWIKQRTGISSRSRASESETLDFMCIEAVRDALKNLPYDIKEVDTIIFASYTPDDTISTPAYVVQREFKIEGAKALFVSAACSSSINGIETISAYFKAGISSKALLISADRNSTYSHDEDLKSGHLWGDAAVAMFFSKDRLSDSEGEVINVISEGLGTVGKGPSGVYLNPKTVGLQMPYGRDVFIYACKHMAGNAIKILKESGYGIEDLNYFIGHQANMRILKNVAEQLNIPEDKLLTNIEDLGNTGCASCVLAFSQNIQKFKKGDLICLSVFGGGYSSGACLIKY